MPESKSTRGAPLAEGAVLDRLRAQHLPTGRALEDVDLELKVLGAALVHPDTVQVVAGMDPACWYRPRHRVLAERIAAAHREGWPVSADTLAADLRRLGILGTTWTEADLVELLAGAAYPSDILHFAGRLAQLARDREAQRIGQRLATGNIADEDLQRIAQLATGAPGTAQVTSWAPVSLAEALEGNGEPPPALLERSDGPCLLYAGKIHWFQGESESLKSWAAQHSAAQSIAAGRDVVYIDNEDAPLSVVARLAGLGTPLDLIQAHLVYVNPEEPLANRHGDPTAAEADFLRLLDSRPWALAIVDGVTESMTTEGLNLMDNADIASWIRRVPRRLAKTGAAVVVIDHLTKSKETQGRHAIGGQHKLAGLDGAAYRFDQLQRLHRATGSEPTIGRSKLTVTKDRPGYVRAIAAQECVGIFEVTSWPDGGITASIDPPTDEPTAPDGALVLRILEHLDTYDGSSGRRIEEAVDGKSTAIRDALKWLASDTRGWIRVERHGNSHQHFLTDLGRDQL